MAGLHVRKSQALTCMGILQQIINQSQ